MKLSVRSWSAAGIAVLALTAVPEMYAVVHASGVASADVCVGAGRRVSVSGCANIADTVNAYVPPPAYHAPRPEDFRRHLPHRHQPISVSASEVDGEYMSVAASNRFRQQPVLEKEHRRQTTATSDG